LGAWLKPHFAGEQASKARIDALPPGTIQIVQIHAMLWKIETGNATASDIEEFRRLAGGPAELATAVSIEP
jgi:hypothetical protein